MKKIFIEAEKKFVEVRHLKNLTFKSHPGWKFFVHRTFDSLRTFTVTEASTGVPIVAGCDTVKIAIAQAEFKLSSLMPDSSTSIATLKSAVEVTKERILQACPNTTFPVNR